MFANIENKSKALSKPRIMSPQIEHYNFFI